MTPTIRTGTGRRERVASEAAANLIETALQFDRLEEHGRSLYDVMNSLAAEHGHRHGCGALARALDSVLGASFTLFADVRPDVTTHSLADDMTREHVFGLLSAGDARGDAPYEGLSASLLSTPRRHSPESTAPGGPDFFTSFFSSDATSAGLRDILVKSDPALGRMRPDGPWTTAWRLGLVAMSISRLHLFRTDGTPALCRAESIMSVLRSETEARAPGFAAEFARRLHDRSLRLLDETSIPPS